MAEPDLTFARLREVLHYDPDTGIFTCITARGSRSKIGDQVGSVSRYGYLMIVIDWQRYYAHRLAWFYVHGEWPVGDVDHIDRNRANNRISNLRHATRRENRLNTPAKSLCGYKGVSRGPRGMESRYRARIKVDNKEVLIGWFDDAESAARAYDQAAREHYGPRAWLNFPSDSEIDQRRLT